MSSKSTNHTHKKIDPPSYRKLNIFSAGGKGGVGKTTLMTALAEWFDAKGREYVLLDLDTENRTKGGLQYHYRNAEKVASSHPIRRALTAFSNGQPHSKTRCNTSWS